MTLKSILGIVCTYMFFCTYNVSATTVWSADLSFAIPSHDLEYNWTMYVVTIQNTPTYHLTVTGIYLDEDKLGTINPVDLLTLTPTEVNSNSGDAFDVISTVDSTLNVIPFTVTAINNGFVADIEMFNILQPAVGVSDGICNESQCVFTPFIKSSDDGRLFKPIRYSDTTNGFTRVVTNVAPNVVPIPAAVWLFSTGIIGLFGLARRKANTNS